MPDSSPNSQPPGTHPQPLPFVQISKELIEYVRSLKLTGTQYDLWLFLFSLDPYGDRFIDVPTPKDIGTLLNVDHRTIERAAQRLADCNLFEFQIERWKARNRKASIIFPQNPLGKEIQNWPNGSKWPQLDQVDATGISLPRVDQTSSSKPAQGKGSKNRSVPNKEQTLLEQTNTVPTPHPVSKPNEQEGDLVLAQILLQVEETGIRLNKTIRRTIHHLTQQLGTSAAAARIRNALSATQERLEQGNLRNPGGFFNKALKDGYTANQAKAIARERQTSNSPAPLALHTVEFAIDQALLNGDRSFALARLQELWQAGSRESVEQLCILRKRDWQFIVTNEGIRDDL